MEPLDYSTRPTQTLIARWRLWLIIAGPFLLAAYNWFDPFKNPPRSAPTPYDVAPLRYLEASEKALATRWQHDPADAAALANLVYNAQQSGTLQRATMGIPLDAELAAYWLATKRPELLDPAVALSLKEGFEKRRGDDLKIWQHAADMRADNP